MLPLWSKFFSFRLGRNISKIAVRNAVTPKKNKFKSCIVIPCFLFFLSMRLCVIASFLLLAVTLFCPSFKSQKSLD